MAVAASTDGGTTGAASTDAGTTGAASTDAGTTGAADSSVAREVAAAAEGAGNKKPRGGLLGRGRLEEVRAAGDREATRDSRVCRTSSAHEDVSELGVGALVGAGARGDTIAVQAEPGGRVG